MATQNPTLTERSIKALKPRSTVYRVRDGIQDPGLKGFGVVVAPSGTRSFFLSFTSPETGGRTQGTLGIFPAMGLADARAKAREWRQMIHEGVDPVLEGKRQAHAEQRARRAEVEAQEREANLGTVAQLFDLYARDLEADGKRSAEYVRKIYAHDIAPAIGAKRAKDVTPDDCADIVAIVAERGALTLANRVRGYLISAFNFGLRVRNAPRWRRVAPDFALNGNPATATERALKHEPRGQRWLSRDEVRQVWKALGEPYEVTGGRGAKRMASLDTATQIAIRLLLATGQRVEEVLHATWDEFDSEGKLWTIPATRRKNAAKNISGEPHLVPLTELHLELMKELKPFSEGSHFLFPARVERGEPEKPRDHRSLSQAITRLCARTGIEHFAPRDIRRTWKTLAGSIGIDLEIRNRVQGHAFDDVGSRNYDRYSYMDEKRQAVERWTAYLGAIIAERDTVVPFAKPAKAG